MPCIAAPAGCWLAAPWASTKAVPTVMGGLVCIHPTPRACGGSLSSRAFLGCVRGMQAQELRTSTIRAGGCKVVGMAAGRRVAKVSQQLKRELSLLLLSDKRVRVAVSPEERMGADAVLNTLVSVTDVRMSGDLQVAKVYVSFFGPDGRGEEIAFGALQKLEGYMRSQVGKAMGLQRVPELRFLRDDSFLAASKVVSIIDGLHSQDGAEDDDRGIDEDGEGDELQLEEVEIGFSA